MHRGRDPVALNDAADGAALAGVIAGKLHFARDLDGAAAEILHVHENIVQGEAAAMRGDGHPQVAATGGEAGREQSRALPSIAGLRLGLLTGQGGDKQGGGDEDRAHGMIRFLWCRLVYR